MSHSLCILGITLNYSLFCSSQHVHEYNVKDVLRQTTAPRKKVERGSKGEANGLGPIRISHKRKMKPRMAGLPKPKVVK